jgi:hypothetical protein
MSFLDKAKKLAGQAAADGLRAQPGAADAYPARPDGFTAQPGAADAVPVRAADAPAQPDLSGGQPDDPAYSAPVSAGLPPEPLEDRASEPVFSVETADVTFPAQPPTTRFPAEPDTAAGQPDDPSQSPAPTGTEFPGLSEGPVGTPEADDDDRPHPSGPTGSSTR